MQLSNQGEMCYMSGLHAISKSRDKEISGKAIAGRN